MIAVSIFFLIAGGAVLVVVGPAEMTLLAKEWITVMTFWKQMTMNTLAILEYMICEELCFDLY